MKDTVQALGKFIPNNSVNTCTEVPPEIIRYYSEAGLDYEPWSAQFNMHFGFYRWGLNPFNREALLEEMNRQIFQRLKIEKSPLAQLIDLGCGVGASARQCVKERENTLVTGATVVPSQIEQAERLTEKSKLSQRLCFRLMDYRNLPFEQDSFDGAYAIESSCYDKGTSKSAFIKEAHRVLKPGSRLVVADGFRKKEKSNPIFEAAFNKVCEGWSLETFANIKHFSQALEDAGFEDICIEDASWRILPSVLHVPGVSLRYFLQSIAFRQGERKLQKLHLIAPLMGIIIGLHRRDFGYYIVSARKPEH